MNRPELAANALNAASILLAGRNSVHTWWTGIAGCLLFGWVFYAARLYADTTLQAFFVVTSALGWWHWLRGGERRTVLPVRRTSPTVLAAMATAGAATALAYGLLLHRFTDAYAPLPDSFVLAFSVIGQLLLMARRVETWWCWLLVNSVAVPLFVSRGLLVTAVLYAAFWVNAVVALGHWRRQVEAR